MRDLLTNKRYGLGNYMTNADLDIDQLISDAAYCDELVDNGAGGLEVRHRLDVVIDSRVKAMDLITQLSASFRGLPFYSMGKVNLKIDRPQAYPTQIFGMGNIIKDSFSQKWKSDKERFNMIEVQFLDKDKDYQQETIVVVDEEAFETNNEDQKPHQIRLFVTRMSEAIREGRYALKVSKLIEKIVAFKTQINAIVAQPGDRIELSHDVPQIGFSGTVRIGSTTTEINLDREVTIEAAITYKLRVIFADDTTEEKEVTNVPGTYTALTVADAFSQAPAAFDKYVFGQENILTEPLRIVNIERDNADRVTIGAVQYKEDVYTDDTLILPETKYSTLDTSFPKVTNIRLDEFILKNEDGIVANYIDVTFTKPLISDIPVKSYAFARVYISDNNGVSWILAGETMSEYLRIEMDLVPGTTYKVAVVAVNGRGIEGKIDATITKSILIHTSITATIDLWAMNRDYILDNVGIVQGNLYDPTYTRDIFAIQTANSWNDIEGQDWDGFDLDDQTVAASGSIEQAVAIDLGMKSKYLFSPVTLFKNNTGGSARIQISKSDDNITFDAFADVNPSTEYQTRYVKFKHFLETSDTSEQVLLYSDKIGVDSPRVLT
jgi:predicted phage tail protein